MEAQALLPTPSTTYLPVKSPRMMIGYGIRVNHNPCSIFANGYSSYTSSSSSSFPFFGQNLSVGPKKSVSVIVAAKKKDKKEDSHSFIPKPDEATGFFPEAVLLREVISHSNPCFAILLYQFFLIVFLLFVNIFITYVERTEETI